MPFVNELIPAADFDRYRLREIDAKHVVGGVNARQWTIDRDRDSYLRRLTRGREDWSHVSDWTFRWQGADYTLHVHLIDASGRPNEPGTAKWSLVRINGDEVPLGIPEPKAAFLSDLLAAFAAYKDGGIYAQSTEFKAELVLGEEARP